METKVEQKPLIDPETGEINQNPHWEEILEAIRLNSPVAVRGVLFRIHKVTHKDIVLRVVKP